MARLPDPLNPFSSNEHLMFIGDNSPVQRHLRSGLALRFHRALHAAGTGAPNNASGLCFVGQRGVGKSHLLRSVALAATTLLPNFVAVTIDATRGSTANVQPDQSAVCLLGAFQRQYYMLGVPGVAQKKTVGSVLDVAGRNGLATGVFVDEARHLHMRTAPGAADAVPQEADQPLDSSWEQCRCMRSWKTSAGAPSSRTACLFSPPRSRHE
jgi:hypothetical protein